MSYTHLTQQERYVISHLRVARFSIREIARRLNRHHATISRELKRARSRYPVPFIGMIGHSRWQQRGRAKPGIIGDRRICA